MILFTLDISYFRKQSKIYLIVSFICLVLGLVYESFSHQVYSAYMLFAFTIPLFFGCLLSEYIYSFKIKNITRLSVNLYNASIANFTIYSLIKGVLDIYGTTNSKINIYLILGIIFIILSILIHIQKTSSKFRNQNIK